MGINVPQVRYIVQCGPTISKVNLMQQAGRGGRDGSHAYCVTDYIKHQLFRYSKDVKSVVNAKECQRQALYNHFSDTVLPLSPSHLCCSNCNKKCACDHGGDLLKHFLTFPFQQYFCNINLFSVKVTNKMNYLMCPEVHD